MRASIVLIFAGLVACRPNVRCDIFDYDQDETAIQWTATWSACSDGETHVLSCAQKGSVKYEPPFTCTCAVGTNKVTRDSGPVYVEASESKSIEAANRVCDWRLVNRR